MKYRVDTKDMNRLVAQVQKSSDTALMKCGLYLEQKIKEQIQVDSYDTGQLANSISTQRVNENKVVVGSNLQYALVREHGRRPGRFPPLQALVGWTARKGMISGGATARYDDLHYTDKGIIFVIARAIAIRGIKGKHTFENVVKREQQNIINLYADLMSKG